MEDTSRIEELLGYFDFHGFNYTRDSLRCAVPNGDNTSSVAIYLNENLYGMVYTRGSFKGDIFHVIENITNRPLSEVFSITRSLFGISSGKRVNVSRISLVQDMKKYRKKRNGETANELYEKSILDEFVHLPHEEIIQEGVSPLICERFSICYDTRDDRVVFPHYSWDHPDKIVGLQARKVCMSTEEANLLGVPKYINKIRGYKKSENLYGWGQAYENIVKKKQIILHEGEKSVLKEFTFSKGEGTSVALGGHFISDTHIKIIAQNTPVDTEVILSFDRDVIDDPAEFQAMMIQAQRMSMFRKVSYIKDPFQVGVLLGEKDSPVDKGIKVWRYLLESRQPVR